MPFAHAHEQATVRRDAPVGVAVGAVRGRSRRDRPRNAPAGRSRARRRRAGCRALISPRALLIRRRRQILPVQPLVGLVAEDDTLAAAGRQKGDVHAAAVLVHQGTGAHAGRGDVCDRAAGCAPHDHVAAVLEWAHLGPVQAPAGALWPHDADAALCDQPGRDRGPPGAVGRDSSAAFRLLGWSVRLACHRGPLLSRTMVEARRGSGVSPRLRVLPAAGGLTLPGARLRRAPRGAAPARRRSGHGCVRGRRGSARPRESLRCSGSRSPRFPAGGGVVSPPPQPAPTRPAAAAIAVGARRRRWRKRPPAALPAAGVRSSDASAGAAAPPAPLALTSP